MDQPDNNPRESICTFPDGSITRAIISSFTRDLDSSGRVIEHLQAAAVDLISAGHQYTADKLTTILKEIEVRRIRDQKALANAEASLEKLFAEYQEREASRG